MKKKKEREKGKKENKDRRKERRITMGSCILSPYSDAQRIQAGIGSSGSFFEGPHIMNDNTAGSGTATGTPNTSVFL